jgi:Asp-tRNA(Asn)/Glu-tRNA(Gln) amidotransferase A subunit family amidase
VGLDSSSLRFAVARTAEWPHASPAMQAQFDAGVAALVRAGACVEEPALPAGLDECVPVHRTIMQFEGAEALGPLVAAHPGKASETLRRYVEAGSRLARAEYEAALQERSQLVQRFAAWAAAFDAIVTPPAVGQAPGPETTGDPRFCTRWTLAGAPAITLPTGLGPDCLPLGLQLAGAPGADRRLLRAAAWVERILPAPAWSPSRLGARP